MPGKALVIYFSLTGRTRMMAKAIAKEIGADLEEVSPLKCYPLRGAWLYMYGGIQSLLGITTPIEPIIADIADYDTLIIGSPIWAGKMAPPLRTFLTQADLTGKKTAFFCTSGGGGSTEFLKEMRELTKGEFIGELGVKMSPKVADTSIKQARAWAREIQNKASL